MGKIKLQTNVPLIGVIENVGYWAGKKDWKDPKNPSGPVKDLPDQISLVGRWEGIGEGTLYLDTWAVPELKLLGAIADNGQEYGHPAYKVISRRSVRILKTEKDGNRKETTFNWADGPDAAVENRAARSAPAPRPSSDWITLQERYQNSIGIVQEAYAKTRPNLTDEAFVAAVAACFIQASKENL